VREEIRERRNKRTEESIISSGPVFLDSNHTSSVDPFAGLIEGRISELLTSGSALFSTTIRNWVGFETSNSARSRVPFFVKEKFSAFKQISEVEDNTWNSVDALRNTCEDSLVKTMSSFPIFQIVVLTSRARVRCARLSL
jgi:hypothetical protein